MAFQKGKFKMWKLNYSTGLVTEQIQIICQGVTDLFEISVCLSCQFIGFVY